MNSFATATQDGTGASIDIELGWVPDHVIVQNIEAADIGKLEWFKGMTAGHAIKRVTSTSSAITSLGITQLSSPSSGAKGFRIGADTDVNVSGEALTWLAWRNTP